MTHGVITALSIPLIVIITSLVVYLVFFLVAYLIWKKIIKKTVNCVNTLSNSGERKQFFAECKVIVLTEKFGIGPRFWFDLEICSNGICLLKDSFFGKKNLLLVPKLFIPWTNLVINNDELWLCDDSIGFKFLDGSGAMQALMRHAASNFEISAGV